MNVETREIRDAGDLTDEERSSGKWIPVAKKWAKKYVQKQPVTDADFTRILAAEGRRWRRNEKRARHASGGGNV